LSLVDPGDPEALMALPPGVRAYLATRLFEWEVGNGGLHQYFFNYPSPDLLTLVLDGYSYLRLPDARRVVEELVAPVAEAEHAWRNSLRDGTIEGFFASYPESCLPSYDDRIGYPPGPGQALAQRDRSGGPLPRGDRREPGGGPHPPPGPAGHFRPPGPPPRPWGCCVSGHTGQISRDIPDS
jgi:hypothetical protein